AFVEGLLKRRGQERFALGGRPDWDGRLLDDTIVDRRHGHVLAVVEYEARTDKQVRGAMWDLIEYGAPIRILVWASSGYGSAGGPRLVRKWIMGLAKRFGTTGDELTARFIVLTDKMTDDDPEVVRLINLLSDVSQARAGHA